MSEFLGETTEDAFLGGALRLRQPKSGHRAGHDAMLLAAATPVRAGDRVVEFGAGVGAAGLALKRREGAIELVLVEIHSGLAALARDNAAANKVSADVVVLDVTSAAEAFTKVGPFDETLRFGEDSDWFKRAAEAALTIERLPNVSLLIRRHAGNMTRGKSMVELNVLRVFKKALDRQRSN